MSARKGASLIVRVVVGIEKGIAIVAPLLNMERQTRAMDAQTTRHGGENSMRPHKLEPGSFSTYGSRSDTPEQSSRRAFDGS